MSKFVEQPQVVDAEQLTAKVAPGSKILGFTVGEDGQGLHTSVNGLRANVGDWVVKDADGVYVYSDAVFKTLYKPQTQGQTSGTSKS